MEVKLYQTDLAIALKTKSNLTVRNLDTQNSLHPSLKINSYNNKLLICLPINSMRESKHNKCIKPGLYTVKILIQTTLGQLEPSIAPSLIRKTREVIT
jgi:hypothetical protein